MAPDTQNHFPFMKLPLELRKMVYAQADLKGPLPTNSEHILVYVNCSPTIFVAVVDTNSIIRAEAFEGVMEQNTIDIAYIDDCVEAVNEYIRATQFRNMTYSATSAKRSSSGCIGVAIMA